MVARGRRAFAWNSRLLRFRLLLPRSLDARARTLRGGRLSAFRRPASQGTSGAEGWSQGRSYPGMAAGAGVVLVDHKHDVDDKRSEEHTSESQPLMRITHVVFCSKK